MIIAHSRKELTYVFGSWLSMPEAGVCSQVALGASIMFNVKLKRKGYFTFKNSSMHAWLAGVVVDVVRKGAY